MGYLNSEKLKNNSSEELYNSQISANMSVWGEKLISQISGNQKHY